jgi:asparagine synthase (glutamine-hydrolysing)
MCGIVLARTKEEAERMLEVLEHRGRDDRRIETWCGCWYVGQNRLQIVGGAGAFQPYLDEHGVTTFNGEIYNYKEIFIDRNPKPFTEVAVLSELLKEHSQFDRVLDGYYAIIRVDNRGITLSRDLFGVMPLYYSMSKGRLTAVASEKKALTGDIFEVRAATTLWFSFDGDMVEIRTFDPYSLHLEDLDVAHLEFLFRRAVKRRYAHSEVPVTVSLSGGLDSSLVLWTAAQLRLKVDAITVGYDENSDEVLNARELANLCNVDWTFVKLNEVEVEDHAEKIRYHLEDPEENPIKWRGMLRNYFVAKNAKGTVILCGEGADEIGAGYPSHQRVGEGISLEWKSLSTIRSMPAINLDRVNKGGMAWTKEFRTPFLDRALALYVISCKKEQNKGVFRKLADRIGLPGFVLRKPKYGSEEKALEAFR